MAKIRYAVVPVSVDQRFSKGGMPQVVYTVVEQRVVSRCDTDEDAQDVARALNKERGNEDRVDTVTGTLMPVVEDDELPSGLALKIASARPHEDRMVHHAGPGYLIFRTKERVPKNWVRWVPEGKEVQTTTKRKRR